MCVGGLGIRTVPADSAMRDRNVIGLGAGEGGECRESENGVRERIRVKTWQ